MNDNTQLTYSTTEAAALLGYSSASTILIKINEGTLKAFRVGPRCNWRITQAEIDRIRSGVAFAPDTSGIGAE